MGVRILTRTFHSLDPEHEHGDPVGQIVAQFGFVEFDADALQAADHVAQAAMLCSDEILELEQDALCLLRPP
jgi:hypothetical protein